MGRDSLSSKWRTLLFGEWEVLLKAITEIEQGDIISHVSWAVWAPPSWCQWKKTVRYLVLVVTTGRSSNTGWLVWISASNYAWGCNSRKVWNQQRNPWTDSRLAIHAYIRAHTHTRTHAHDHEAKTGRRRRPAVVTFISELVNNQPLMVRYSYQFSPLVVSVVRERFSCHSSKFATHLSWALGRLWDKG